MATEAEVANYVEAWLREAGGATVERQEVLPGRSNIVARIPGRDSGAAAFAMVAHMDTVPIGEGWTHDPFGAEIADGNLYGRGACDVKSGLAAAMTAFAGAARSGAPPARDILLCATVDEEGSHMRGVNALVDGGILDRDSLVVATEPSDLAVVVSHKGLLWLEVSVTGKLAHAGNPQVGVDAIRAAAEFVTRFHDAIAGLPHRHEVQGPPTATFSRVSGGIKTNVVPDAARLEVDIRLPPPMSLKDVHEIAGHCGAAAADAVPGSRFRISQLNNDRPPVETDTGSALVRAFLAASGKVTGCAQLEGFPAYTDASVVQARTGCPTALVFGPGRLAQAHTIDEYVPVQQIDAAERVLAEVIQGLCYV